MTLNLAAENITQLQVIEIKKHNLASFIACLVAVMIDYERPLSLPIFLNNISAFSRAWGMRKDAYGYAATALKKYFPLTSALDLWNQVTVH